GQGCVVNATESSLALVNARWRSGPRFEQLREGTLVLGGGRVLADSATGAPHAQCTLDLDGALVLPGLVDTHTHLGWAGQGLWSVDWSRAHQKTAALARLERAARRIEPGFWLLGGGWSRTLLPDAELPTLDELDHATGTTPLFVTSVDGSLALANTRALHLLRLTNGADSALPPGEELELDQHGQLSGRLRGAAVHARA